MLTSNGESFYKSLEKKVEAEMKEYGTPVQDLVLALEMVKQTVILEEMTRRLEAEAGGSN